MKKKIDIKKKIEFSSMIGEICAISLENDLAFVDGENIEGSFVLSGKYKTTVASRIEENFHYDIPVQISLTEKVDPLSGKIDITDFYYDIVEGNSLLCHIEISVMADEVVEERECDGDPVFEKEVELPHIEDSVAIPISTPEEEEKKEEEKIEREEEKETPKEELEEVVEDSSFFHFSSTSESYGTFIVYLVRENETINSILEKYQTTVEEVQKYNDLKNITMGSKIIIPITNEKDS